MEITPQLIKFYALFLAYGRNITAIADDMLADIGMTQQDARALLSRQDFPWAELDDELSRRENYDRIGRELGVSAEQLHELRRHTRPVDQAPLEDELHQVVASLCENSNLSRADL